MYRDVLEFVVAHGGAPITEIQQAFALPKEMAACLCVELQDAGFLADQALSPCHHQDPDTSCSACSGGSCKTDDHQDHPVEFKQGCCGLNSPYQVTPSGLAYLSSGG